MARKPPTKCKSLSDQLRQIVLDCGESRYAIWKATGIDQSILSKFVNGTRPLTLKNIDKLAEHLGLELIRKPRKGE